MLFDYKTIHDACGWHEELVRKSQKCGYFSCLSYLQNSFGIIPVIPANHIADSLLGVTVFLCN
jgi:hypothetical protein